MTIEKLEQYLEEFSDGTDFCFKVEEDGKGFDSANAKKNEGRFWL